MSLALDKVRLFSSLPPEQLSKLQTRMVKREFKKGDLLLAEDSGDGGFYLLTEGEAKMLARDTLHQPRLVEVVKPGGFFGELSLVTEEPTPYWVEASSKLVAYYLAPDDFQEFLTEHPDSVFDVFDVLARRLLRLEHAFRRRASQDVNVVSEETLTTGQRVADFFANTIGSWPFIIIQSVILATWIVLNVVGWVKAWDPYPFILLNLALSFQAAYAGPIIMMSQNRQNDKDRLSASIDHEVNLKSELEVGLLIRKLEGLERLVHKKLAEG